MSVVVRDARPEELAPLAARVAGQPLLARYEIGAARLETDLRAALARGEGLLVADDGAPRGFAWFLPSGTFAAGGYLKLIALEPRAEGRGLGGALLDEIERRVALASRSMFLLVSDWNQDARRFYDGRGYAEVGRLPAFVRADTDEIICWKRLR